MRPFAALLLVLLASAPLAGCLDAADAVEDAAAAAATAATCEEGRVTVIDWTPPESPGGERREQVDVEVPAGTRGLEIDWTPPAASAGSHDVELKDPAGETVFRNSLALGATFAGGSVSIGGMRNNGDATLRAAPGTYAFSWSVDGEYVDVRLVVAATGCF